MLSPTDLLDFESSWPAHSGQKEEEIRAVLGLTPARYYQRLHRAIDTIEAVHHDPVLVYRLRRQRDRLDARHRAQQRTR